jgi:mRNA-degrading endonuclease YafQ of YafQ-DinJ toxin-antitoxin module
VNLSYTSLFHRSYNGLTAQQQKQIDKAIRRLHERSRPPFPRGWRVHKLEGVRGTPSAESAAAPDVWEMHAPGSGALVVTFQYSDDEILFRNCGPHDKTLQSP